MAEVKQRTTQCQIVDCQPFSSRCLDVTYHMLPKNAEKRRLWIRTIGKKNIRNLQSSRPLICSLHFQMSDFVKFKYGQEKERRHLVTSAIPSKFPWSENWGADFPGESDAAPGVEDNMDGANETAQVAKLKIYRCQMCAFVSNKKDDYQNHLKNHSSVCPICQFKAAGVKRLVRHIEKNHKTEIRFRCSACSFGSDKRNLTDSHIRTRVRKDPQHRRAKIITVRKSRKRKVLTNNSTEPKKKRLKKSPEEMEAGGTKLDEPDGDSTLQSEENDATESETVSQEEGNGHAENGIGAEEFKEENVTDSHEENPNGKTVYVCKICLYWSTSRLGADTHAKKHVNKSIHCSVCFSCFQKHSGAATHMARTKTPVHTGGRIIFLTGLRRADLIATTEAFEPHDATVGYLTSEEPFVKELFPDREEFFREILENASVPKLKRRKAIQLTRRKKKRGPAISTLNPAADKDPSESYRKVYTCPHCDYWSCVCDLFLRHLEVHGIYKKRHRCSACDAVFSWFSKAKMHVTEAAKSSGDHEKAQVITTDEGSASYVVKVQSSLIGGRKQGFLKDIKSSAVDCNSDVEDALSTADATLNELEQESEIAEGPSEEPQTPTDNPPAETAVPELNDSATWVNEADHMLSISPIHNEEDDMLKLECVFPLTAGFCSSDVCLESLSSQGSQRTVEELDRDELRLKSELSQKSNSLVRNNVSLKDLLKTVVQSRKTLVDLQSKYNANFDRLTRALADQREMESIVKNTQDRLAELQKDFDSLSNVTLQSELNVRSKQVELIKLQLSKASTEERDVLSTELADLEAKLHESKSGMEAVKGQMKDIEERMRKVQADLRDFDENHGGFVSDMQETEQRIHLLKEIIKDSNSNIEIVLSKRIDLMKSLTEIKYSLEIIRINKILSRPDYTELLMADMEGISHQGTQTNSGNCTNDGTTSTDTECPIVDRKTTPDSENLIEPVDSGINDESQLEENAAVEGSTDRGTAEESSKKVVDVSDIEVSMEVELEAEAQQERAESHTSAAAVVAQEADNGDEEELVMEAVMETPESSPPRMQASSHSDPTEVNSASTSQESHPQDENGAAKNVPAPEGPKLTNRDARSRDSAASPSSSGNSRPNSATLANLPVVIVPIVPRRIDAQPDCESGSKPTSTVKSVPGLIPVPELNRTGVNQEEIRLTSEVTLTEIRQKLGIPRAAPPKEIIIRMAPLEDVDCLRTDDELVEVTPPGLTLANKSLPEISVTKTETPSSSASGRRSTEKMADFDDVEDVVILSSTTMSANRRKQILIPQRQDYAPSSTASVFRMDPAVRPSVAGLLNNATLQSVSQSSIGPVSQAGPPSSLPAATFGLIRAKGKNYYPSSVISLAGPSTVSPTSSQGFGLESALNRTSFVPSSIQTTLSQSFVVESTLNRGSPVSRGQAPLPSNGNSSVLTSLGRPEFVIPVRSTMSLLESGPRPARCYPPQTVIPRSNITLLKPEFGPEDMPRSSAAYMRISPSVSKPLPMLTVAPFAKDMPLQRPIRIIDSIGSQPPMAQGPLFRHPISNSINGFVNARYPGPNQPGVMRFGPFRPPPNRNTRPY